MDSKVAPIISMYKAPRVPRKQKDLLTRCKKKTTLFKNLLDTVSLRERLRAELRYQFARQLSLLKGRTKPELTEGKRGTGSGVSTHELGLALSSN
jgi:hypothetical protein